MYQDDFNSAEKDIRWTFKKIFWPLIGLMVILGITGLILGWFGNAADVAKKEYYPDAMLKKYSWFIDQSNAIKKMDQDITIYRTRVSTVDSTYGPTSKMDAVTRAMYAKDKQNAVSDLAAVISQRNNLVKEYNSQSEKFTWEPFNTKPDKPVYKFDLVNP